MSQPRQTAYDQSPTIHPGWCSPAACTTNLGGSEHRSAPTSSATCDDRWQTQLHRFDAHDDPQPGITELHVRVVSMVDVNAPAREIVLRMDKDHAQRLAGLFTTEQMRAQFLP